MFDNHVALLSKSHLHIHIPNSRSYNSCMTKRFNTARTLKPTKTIHILHISCLRLSRPTVPRVIHIFTYVSCRKKQSNAARTHRSSFSLFFRQPRFGALRTISAAYPGVPVQIIQQLRGETAQYCHYA